MEIELSDSSKNISLNTKHKISFDCKKLTNNTYSIILNGKSHFIIVNKNENDYNLTINHQTQTIKIQDEFDLLIKNFTDCTDATKDSGKVYVQIPGLINKIFVKKGDYVKINQKLFILEAMKMENEITSPYEGFIHKILYCEGDSIEKGKLIMKIKNEL